MARTRADDQWHESDERHDIGGWQALRSDLLDLLHTDAAAGQAAPPDRTASGAMGGRRRQALRSVTETMERFSSRRNTEIDSAIAQIRRRHAGETMRRPDHISQFEDEVNGMSARLERLGGALRQTHEPPAGLKEIADQVAQLAEVVELLAGAVGESGQVKRLESQIAQLARLVSEGRQPAAGVSERLDRITRAIDQMSAVQEQYAEKPLSHLQELNSTHKSGLKSIEDGVRNIYDRIDALEQNLSLNPADVDRLTREMATISAEMSQANQALKAGGGTSSVLLERIDALDARVGQMGGGNGGPGGDVGGLRADISALREAVRETVEPRFSALESQIDSLDQRLGAPGEGEISPQQLEGQIRQLMARMDQTGEQLADIKHIYESQSGQTAGAGGGQVELSAANIDELELRLSKLFGAVGNSVEAGAFSQMYASLQRVDERLSRLEETLKAEGGETPASRAQPEWRDTAPLADFGAHDMAHAPEGYPPLGDSMDINPSEDRPLVDRGFGDPASVSTPPDAHDAAAAFAMEAKPPEPEMAGPGALDPDMVERPRKPKSSLFADEEPAFAAPQTAPDAREDSAPRQPVSASSRNTFIEAARRAAQKQDEPAASNAQSIIARALNRFQNPGEAGSSREPLTGPHPEKPQPNRAAAKAEKAARARMQAEAQSGTRRRGADGAPRESFISRHRRVLLLSAALVTICLLTFNLIERRLNPEAEAATPVSMPEEAAPAEPATSETEQSLLDPQPTGSVDPFVRVTPDRQAMLTQNLPTVLSEAARDMNSLDREISTGSIADAPEDAAPAEAPAPSPIKLELPPEAVGPLTLRQAAANGDPRAQFEVAAIYSEGQALTKDMAEAAKWYERAAAQGFAPAEYRLGNLYEHGEGVTRDLMQAKLWYQRAAEAGNRMAMHNLAALYAGGEMGEQEFSLAAEWFERAAGSGLTDSQFNLGMLYARGLGVTQNMAASYKWFSLAAMRGDAGAAKARDDVARSLDPETVSQVKKELETWEPAAIDIAANFAPIGTWAEDFNPGQPIGDRKVVENVQGALNRLGFDVGTPDGLMGPRTREAIRAFERATGMSESGTINPRLLAVLGSQPV